MRAITAVSAISVIVLIFGLPSLCEPRSEPEHRLRTRHGTFDIRREGITVAGSSVRLEWLGADGRAIAPGPGCSRMGSPSGGLRCPEIYPGVDLLVHRDATGERLEYDLLVSPHADASVVRFCFAGARRAVLGGNGSIQVEADGGIVSQCPPIASQSRGNGHVAIPIEVECVGGTTFGFRLGPYDRSRALLIDPVLSYATYYGGTKGDEADGVAADASGNAFIGGKTESLDLAVRDALQPSYAGGMTDGFLAKFDTAGELAFATYFGGSGTQGDYVAGLAGDPAGNIYAVGSTDSTDFPVKDAYQGTLGGGTNAFLAKFDPAGGLLSSTYLGGSGAVGEAVATDSAGDAYVTGQAWDSFPLLNPFQAIRNGTSPDAFVSKFSATGSLVYSSYLGGGFLESRTSIAVRPDGGAIVGGHTSSDDFPVVLPLQAARAGGVDGFIAVVAPTGGSLTFSTYLGGTVNDGVRAVATDAAGNIYGAGATESSDYPVKDPYQGAKAGTEDVFLAKIDPATSSYIFSTFIGGDAAESSQAVRVDASLRVHVSGRTASTDFPLVAPVQPVLGGRVDAFYLVMAADGQSLLASTYYGGSQMEDAVMDLDPCENPILAGFVASTDLPVTANAFQPTFSGIIGDAYLARIDYASTPPGPVGDTLKGVREASGSMLHFTWDDVGAASYHLRDAGLKGAGFPRVTASVPSGNPGAIFAVPAAALVFYNVVGVTSCGLEGPF